MIVTNSYEIEPIIPEAHAQIEGREIELRQVRDLEECTKKFVSGASAYIPFTLKVWYDTTKRFEAPIIQQGRSFPILQQTPQVMTFHTNYTDQYQIPFELRYEDARDRQVYIQYLSQGAQVQTEQEHFSGTKYCTQFIIHTSEAPVVPTREEMFGDAYRFFGMIPLLIDGFNQNSLTVSTSITYIWLLIAGMIAIVLYWVIQTSMDKKKFTKATKNMNEFTETANTILDTFDTKMKNFENMTKGIMLNQKSILDFQKEEADLIEQAEQAKQKTEGKKEETIAEKVIEKPVRSFTQTVSKFVKNIKKDKEEETKPKKIEINTDKVEVIEKTEKFTAEEVIQRMSNKTMKIIDIIDIETKEANFKEFTYEDLNEAYSWVTNKIKQNKDRLQNKEMTDKDDIENVELRLRKMSIIQNILHAGATRKWEINNPDQELHNE